MGGLGARSPRSRPDPGLSTGARGDSPHCDLLRTPRTPAREGTLVPGKGRWSQGRDAGPAPRDRRRLLVSGWLPRLLGFNWKL